MALPLPSVEHAKETRTGEAALKGPKRHCGAREEHGNIRSVTQ